jgi:signal transduction histidine kinase
MPIAAAATPTLSLPKSVASAADSHLLEHQKSIWKRTDRLLAGLLVFEWLGAILLATWRSPRAWTGASSSVHPHLWAAGFLGAAVISLPILFVWFRPGSTLTRHTVAAGQMLMSGLLIHLGDGRIEMHFHVFGSLAFIAFYRDWRVLITATVVVALDHLLRGLFLPESIYGVMSATVLRTLEHAGWVVFEDLFLIGSCVQSVREMRGIAVNRALLENSYQDVERQVAQRTAELKSTQEDLMKAARSAGMAEIATSVLHNVGNVLNSVNVSARLVADKLRLSEVPSLTKVSDMMTQHQPDLGDFLTQDSRGKLIPGFIKELAACLGSEQDAMLAEVTNLSSGIDHIKRIVAAQQSMAKTSQVNSQVKPAALIETAIAMQGTGGDMAKSDIEITRNVIDCPEAMLDQHKVLQILINLISNAGHAVMVRPAGQRRITVSLEPIHTPDGDRVRYQVSDNGVGIAQKNLAKIFSHGFTTKKEGHGFGLHSAANAAREMRGSLSASSDGPNKGATFTLEIPVEVVGDPVPVVSNL